MRGTQFTPLGAAARCGIVEAKASLLKDALSELGRTPKDHDVDVVSHMMAQRSLGALMDKTVSTGSATVRETLGSTAYSGTRPRVVETCLLGSGEAGLMTVEGAADNPSPTDLICEAYLKIHHQPEAPIGVDVKSFRLAAERSGRNRIVRQTLAGLATRKLIIGVDRLDYSKGIPDRMEAFERFLVGNPDWRGRVTYLQIAPTSRSDVPEYAALQAEPLTRHLAASTAHWGSPVGFRSTM